MFLSQDQFVNMLATLLQDLRNLKMKSESWKTKTKDEQLYNNKQYNQIYNF